MRAATCSGGRVRQQGHQGALACPKCGRPQRGSQPDGCPCAASGRTAAADGLASTLGRSLLGANCSAAWALAWAVRSSIFASPKTTYVSEAGLLNTSGFWMTNRICARHPGGRTPRGRLRPPGTRWAARSCSS